MDKTLNDYLEKVDKYLKPMKVTDRMDIIKEIESDMAELREHGGLSANEIIDRLGEPKKLAQAYLGETITETKGMSFRKLGAMIAFYSMAGLGGIIILPVTGITSIALILSGILCPLCGLVKLLASFVGYDIPFIGFQLVSFSASPALTLILSIIVGLVFAAIGWGLWLVTKAYIRAVSAGSEKIRGRK